MNKVLRGLQNRHLQAISITYEDSGSLDASVETKYVLKETLKAREGIA